MVSNLILRESVKVTIRIMEHSKSQLISQEMFKAPIAGAKHWEENSEGGSVVYLRKVWGIVCVNPLPQLNPLMGR